MTNKKKNSTKDRGSVKIKNVSTETSGIEFGPNGPINYTPPVTLPRGIRAACHLHVEKPMYFKTLEDAVKHQAVVHDYRKAK